MFFTLENDRPPLSINSHLPPPTQQRSEPVPVTPNEGDIQTDAAIDTVDNDSVLKALSDALTQSLKWKPNMKMDESNKPHPLKLHLETSYNGRQTLKSVLCAKYQNLNEILYEGRKVQDYPVCIRLFLLSLCATLFGIPTDYQVNPWLLVAHAWGYGIRGKDIEEACKSAISEYVSPDQEGRIGDDAAKERVSSCMQSWKDLMRWPYRKRTGLDAFCDGLTTRYKDTHLFADIFATPQSPWKIDTKMFLFAIMTSISGGTTIRSPIQLVQKHVAGCKSRTPLQNHLKAAMLIVEMSKHRSGPTSALDTITSPPHAAVIQDDPVPFQNETNISSVERPVVVEDEPEVDLQPALELLRAQLKLDKGSRNPAVQQFFHDSAHKILQEEKKDYVSTLTIRTKNNRSIPVDYFPARRLQKGSCFSELTQANKKERANLVNAVVVHQAGGDPDEQEDLVKLQLKKFSSQLTVLPTKVAIFSMDMVAAIRHQLRVSVNTILRLIQCERGLTGFTRYPAQIKKRLPAVERRNTVPETTVQVPLKANSTGETRLQNFVYVQKPEVLVQHNLETTFIAGTFEKSENFSTHENKIIIPLGCDKDVEQTTMMSRIANRKGGNSSDHVTTLAYFEKGAECYENLESTFLKKGHPTQKFLQLALNNALFVLCVNLIADDELVIDSQCVMLQLFAGGDTTMLPEIELNFQRGCDVTCSRREHNVTNSGLECIGLELDHGWKNEKKFVVVRLVADDSDEESGKDEKGDYYGFVLYLGHVDMNGERHVEPRPFCSGVFEKTLYRDDCSTSCQFSQAVGYYSSDKKNAWLVTGLSDCPRATCNCIACIQPNKTYDDYPPAWLGEKYPANPYFQKKDPNKPDFPLRCGEYSNDKLWVLWDARTKMVLSPTEKQQAILDCGGLKRPPLLIIHPSKHIFGPLHISAGVINHFKDNYLKKFRSTDEMKVAGHTSWKEEVGEKRGDAKDHVKVVTSQHKKLRAKCLKNGRERRSLENLIRRYEDPNTRLPSTTDESVQLARDKLARLEADPELEECNRLERVLAGAKHFIEKIDAYLESEKPKGEAEYAFLIAILLTGQSFNAQHGGMELSNADCISMLENFSKISELVCGTYTSGPQSKRDKVKATMEEAQQLAPTLYEWAQLLKTQRKHTDEMCERQRECSSLIYEHWQKYFTQKCFPKLHDAVSHIPDFTEDKRMFGRLSEECFESYHGRHKKESSNVKSIKDPVLQHEVLNRRLQGAHDPILEGYLSQIKSAMTGRKRGKYKEKAPKERSFNIVSSDIEMDGKEYIRIAQDMSIKVEWHEVYRMVCHGKVPEAWHEAFRNCDSLDDLQKAKAEFSSLQS